MSYVSLSIKIKSLWPFVYTKEQVFPDVWCAQQHPTSILLHAFTCVYQGQLATLIEFLQRQQKTQDMEEALGQAPQQVHPSEHPDSTSTVQKIH